MFCRKGGENSVCIGHRVSARIGSTGGGEEFTVRAPRIQLDTFMVTSHGWGGGEGGPKLKLPFLSSIVQQNPRYIQENCKSCLIVSITMPVSISFGVRPLCSATSTAVAFKPSLYRRRTAAIRHCFSALSLPRNTVFTAPSPLLSLPPSHSDLRCYHNCWLCHRHIDVTAAINISVTATITLFHCCCHHCCLCHRHTVVTASITIAVSTAITVTVAVTIAVYATVTLFPLLLLPLLSLPPPHCCHCCYHH